MAKKFFCQPRTLSPMNHARIHIAHTLHLKNTFHLYILRDSKQLASIFVKKRNRGTPNYAKAVDVMTAVIEGHSCISNMHHCFSPIKNKIYHNSATYFKMLYRLDCRDNFVPWYEVYKLSTVSLLQDAEYEFIKPYVANRGGIVSFDLSALAVWENNFEFADRGYGFDPKQRGYQLTTIAI